MNILHLERKFPGSTETFIVNQINTLPDHDHSVYTINFIDELDSIARVYHPPRKNLLSAKVLMSNEISFFTQKLEVVQPDIVHGHFITDACVFRPLTKKLKVPKVCSCYGYDVSVIPVKYRHFYKFFYNPIIAEYDLFLAMTGEMEKDLLEMGFPQEKIMVHYHGVDTQKFRIDRNYSIKDEKFKVLTVASLLEVKGHETVLRALADVRENYYDFKFEYNIVGQGPLKEELEKLAKALNIHHSVNFLGAVKHGKSFMKLLKEAHAFAHPSVTTNENDKEGIPGAIVEAMASGLPVIATEHGGIPFIIDNEQTGFLVKEKDHRKIAEIIYQLSNKQVVRRKIGAAAQEFALVHLDLIKKSRDLEKIYVSLLRNK